MKRYLYVIALVLLVPLAIIVRQHSQAVLMKETVEEYLEFLNRGDIEYAYTLNTDSLAALYDPELLTSLQDSLIVEKIIAEKLEERGYRCTLILPDGNSRSIWLQRVDGDWRISGDSELDNILGTAEMLCTSYAQGTVVPLLLEGTPLNSFSCPISGEMYIMEDGVLKCPARHLTDGIDVYGRECTLFCDSLNTIINTYYAEGYPPALSFSDMFENSEGAFGQRGGYHCPNNAYTYYEIINAEAVCPVHGKEDISAE